MKWIKENFITMVILFTSIVIGWESVSNKVDTLTERVNKYPSSDYFDLKFKGIDSGMEELSEKLDKHLEKQ